MNNVIELEPYRKVWSSAVCYCKHCDFGLAAAQYVVREGVPDTQIQLPYPLWLGVVHSSVLRKKTKIECPSCHAAAGVVHAVISADYEVLTPDEAVEQLQAIG